MDASPEEVEEENILVEMAGKMADKVVEMSSVLEGKVLKVNTDTAPDMQETAVSVTDAALAQYNVEKEIAAFIRKYFEQRYGPKWHCIVGRNFDSCVIPETNHFVHLFASPFHVLLFKSG